MKYILMACLGIILLSCGEKETVNEVVSMEELIGTEVKDTMADLTVANDTLIIDTSLLGGLIQHVHSDFDTSSNTLSTIFDRFTTESKDKISFISKDSTAERLDFFTYSFKDSIALNNALFNWLDCFGNDCQEVIPNQDVPMVEHLPLWCNIYEDKLTILQTNSGNVDDYTELITAINSLFESPLKYQFKVDQKQKLTWK